jgi:hypothetical protein
MNGRLLLPEQLGHSYRIAMEPRSQSVILIHQQLGVPKHIGYAYEEITEYKTINVLYTSVLLDQCD